MECIDKKYFHPQRREKDTTELPEDTTTLPENEEYVSTGSTSTTVSLEDCDWNEWKGYRQQRYLHFVRDAVYAVAHALHDLQRDRCGHNYNGMCPEMKHIDGDTLRSYLGNVSFEGWLFLLDI